MAPCVSQTRTISNYISCFPLEYEDEKENLLPGYVALTPQKVMFGSCLKSLSNKNVCVYKHIDMHGHSECDANELLSH